MHCSTKADNSGSPGTDLTLYANTDGSGVAEYYYLHDANYNVTAVTDNSGAVLERYSYTPYGQVSVLDADFAADSDGISDVGNTHFYTGRELDPETGLQLNRHRFYASHLGRWLTRDPMGYFANDFNLYQYGRSDPSGQFDPKGLAPCATGQVLVPACCTYCWSCNRTILTWACGYVFGRGKLKTGCDPPKLIAYCATVGKGGPYLTPNTACTQHKPSDGWYCSYWLSAAGSGCSAWSTACDKELAKWLAQAGTGGQGSKGWLDCSSWCEKCVAKGNPEIKKDCVEQICNNSF